jgi:hypothetical protein
MSLFDKLKDTKLKSLKFGEKGTIGDSTKPYIVKDINTVDTPFNKLRLTKFDDGLIRGGAVGAINASAVDTLRVGKFLTDFPKGPLFITKQVGLQLANSPVETKQLPTNRVGNGILGKVVAGASNVINKLNNLVGGPTRIYNLGINTLAQVPVNAFGGHIARHGFLPYLDEFQKYIKVVEENNKGTNSPNNRLVGLRNKFFQLNSSGTTLQADVFKTEISNNFGGASSVYGIGRTIIRRTTYTGRETDITPAINGSSTKTNYGFIPVYSEPTSSFTNKFKYNNKFEPVSTSLDLSNKALQTYNYLTGVTSTDRIDALGFNNIVYQPNDVSDTALLVPQSRTQNATYNRLINQASKVKNKEIKVTKQIVKAGQTSSRNFSFRKLDNQGNVVTSGVNNALKDIYLRDDEKIMTVVFQQLNPFTGNIYKSFRFKAYINGYSETYDSSWDSIKYNGRSEFLYAFNSYKKTATFKLQLPSFNKVDLFANHENLKKLQQGSAGAYSQNRLGGVLTEIKLGGYLNYDPCIISSMGVSIPNDASWDLMTEGSDNSPLSMLLEVNFNIIIIGKETPGYQL